MDNHPDILDSEIDLIEKGFGLGKYSVALATEILGMLPYLECFHSLNNNSEVNTSMDVTTVEGKNFRMTMIAFALTQPEDMRP